MKTILLTHEEVAHRAQNMYKSGKVIPNVKTKNYKS
jgi:hypothetical protein